jgi:hypothetical protein
MVMRKMIVKMKILKKMKLMINIFRFETIYKKREMTLVFYLQKNIISYNILTQFMYYIKT